MSIKTVTHLNFRGQAREALAFYQSVFGGRLTLFTFADAQAVADPAEAEQVIWGEVVSDDGFHVMAMDVPAARDWDPGTIPVFVSVRGSDPDRIMAYWEGLSAGAAVIQPLGPASFSPLYGMLRDRFGITWIVDVQIEPTAS